MISLGSFARTATAAAFLASALGLAAGSPAAQAAPAPKSLDGVWKITRVVITGAGAQTIDRPQPNLLVVARGYYSMVADRNESPRSAPAKAKDRDHLTEPEKAARYDEWRQLTANAGTYEIKGDTLTMHRLTAKSVSVVGTSDSQKVKIVGQTMTLVGTSQPGEPASQTTITYTRVK